MRSNLPEHAGDEILDVSIIIPMRNEQKYIASCLDSLLANGFPEEQYEILVADGESEDASRDVVLAKAAAHPCIRLLHNSGRFVPSGMNLGIRQARGRYIIRVDAHCEYPSDYIQNCIAELQRTGAGNVGGRCLTRPGSDTQMAKAIALFTQTRVGVGNAAYRLGEGDRYVDTVPFGAFPREVFDRVGLYREDLVRNQDFELNARIRGAGYGIYLSSKIASVYYNSGTFRKFMRQAWMNGIWAPRMWFRYRGSFCWRHAAPLGFTGGLLSSLLLGLLWRPALWAGLTGLAVYLAVALATAVSIGARNGWKLAPCVVLVMPCYHFLYGLGSLTSFGRNGLTQVPVRAPVGNADRADPLRGSAEVSRSGAARSRAERAGPGSTMKRLLDFAAASLALVLLSPVLLIVALFVKATSPGPAFYCGKRVGMGGKIFKMYKFRTMVAGADQLGGSCTSEGDARVTRSGYWLRKFKLDELPQLLNVLVGDMSLVGPRPEVQEYVQLFTPEERAILSVRPGITDWASLWDRDEAQALAGHPDPERAYLELIRPEKIRLQLEYVRRRSFRTDLSILFETLRILVLRRSAPSSHQQANRGERRVRRAF